MESQPLDHQKPGMPDISHPIPTVPTHFTFDQMSWLVYWEATRACNLACRHCRAEAQIDRDPCELTTREGETLLTALTRFGDRSPHVVITGGDPLRRPDLFDLIAYGRDLGLAISLAPSVTDLLEPPVFRRLLDLGVQTISLSLDGATPDHHDEIRGIPGCFDRTLDMARAAVGAGLNLQINTLITKGTQSELPAIYDLVKDIGAMRWALFFLIGVGRGALMQEIEASESEALFHWLLDLSRTTPMQVKSTEAPHFRRVAVQRMLANGLKMTDVRKMPLARGFGVRDGNGIMFVSHNGDVYPSGFLPVKAGNVRETDPIEIYRDAPVFRQLRRVDGFSGKCGRCEFRRICGGSRARAHAVHGDALASDPLCNYQPAMAGGRNPVI